MRRSILALCVLCAGLHPGSALAQTGAPAPPAVLTLAASNDGGEPVSALHAGETLVLTGTISPAAVGEPVTVSVALDGRPVRQLTASVDALDQAGAGTFHTSFRPTQPGLVSATAAAAGAAAAPLAVAVSLVGHIEEGCQGPATLTRERASRLVRAADGPLRRGALIEPGARVAVPKGAGVRLRRGRARYRSAGGAIVVECRAVKLLRGRLRAVERGRGRTRVLLIDALATLAGPGRIDVDAHGRRIAFRHGRGRVTTSADPRSTLHTIEGDTVLIDRAGRARMDTWPFAKSPEQRPLRRSAVPPYWADGSACATGCRPAGALTGWPLKPFHEAHPLRAGLNEWRPANMHIGIDIQALDGTPVYAIQSGPASIAGVGTVDIRVHVGSYEYWHVQPSVHAGEYVLAPPDGDRPRHPRCRPSAPLRAARRLRQPAAARWPRAGALPGHRGAGDRRATAQRRPGLRRGLRPAIAAGDDQVPHAGAGAGRDRLACARRARPRADAPGVRLPGIPPLPHEREVVGLRAGHDAADARGRDRRRLGLLLALQDLRPQVELPARPASRPAPLRCRSTRGTGRATSPSARAASAAAARPPPRRTRPAAGISLFD